MDFVDYVKDLFKSYSEENILLYAHYVVLSIECLQNTKSLEEYKKAKDELKILKLVYEVLFQKDLQIELPNFIEKHTLK
jgi:hypothetical protein